MISVIPFSPSIPVQKFETNFDGTNYVLRMRWNYRMGQWFLDIMTEQEEPIAMGLAVTLGSYIGKRVRDSRMPPGLIIASDLSGAGEDATLDDLATRVVVYYYSEDELT